MRHSLIFTLLLAVPVLAGDDAQDGRARLIARRDADGDGRLSLEEFGRDRELFDLLDRNGDGFLTADELPKRRRKARRPSGPAGPDARPGPGPDGGPGARPDGGAGARPDAGPRGGEKARRGPGPEQIQRIAQGILTRFDTNGDGRLTGDEIPAEAGRFDFAKADANQDGVIDLVEITQALQARFKAGRGNRDPARMMMERLKQLDANGDGVIERAEWKGREEIFTRFDADQDGRITKKEIKKAAKAMKGPWKNRAADAAFRRFDADGDGRISREEWKANEKMFDRFDTDKDGFITRAEITPKGPGGGRRAKMLDLRSGKDSAHFLQKFDQNGDGQVTKDEFRHERRFAEIDADGDGVLSEAEIKDAMDRMSREKAYGFLERFDLNGDGQVTRDEFTGPAAAFEKMDRNRDGVIDKADGAK